MQAEQLLPDDVNEIEVKGVTIRKGSVGAFLVNVNTLKNPATPEGVRQAALKDIALAAPILQALGLFEVFEIRDPQLRDFVQSQL